MVSIRSFVVGLLVAGSAALALQLVPAGHADEGGWTCYVADRFPDMQDAAAWKGSMRVAEGLNQVAAHVPKGEILVLELPVTRGWGVIGGGGGQGAPSVVCVNR